MISKTISPTSASDYYLYKTDTHYVIEYNLVSADCTESKIVVYKAKKFETFVNKLNSLLKENGLT